MSLSVFIRKDAQVSLVTDVNAKTALSPQLKRIVMTTTSHMLVSFSTTLTKM